MSKKTEVATTENTGVLASLLAVQDDAAGLPAHLNTGSKRGNEEVGQSDLQQPRLKLLQAISNETMRQHSDYVEGAEPGMFMHSITKALLPQPLYLINLYYVKRWNVWRTQKAGGGPVAFCATEAEAMEELARAVELERINPNDTVRIAETFEVVETPEHWCLMVDPQTGDVEPIIVDMPSTKQKVSKGWNSQLKMERGDRFSTLWELSTKLETNRRNESYSNYELRRVGFVNPTLFEMAEKWYDQVVETFRDVTVDTSEGSLQE